MRRALAVGLLCVTIPMFSCRNESHRSIPRRSTAERRAATNVPAVNAAPSDAAPSPPIDVRAGVGIGPVLLGLSRTDVEALGLSAQPGSDAQTVVYGLYTVHFNDADLVDRVEVTLSSRAAPQGFTTFSRPLPSNPTSLQEVLDAVTLCDPPETFEGGNRASCMRGKISVMQSSAGGAISLRVARTTGPASSDAGVPLRRGPARGVPAR